MGIDVAHIPATRCIWPLAGPLVDSDWSSHAGWGGVKECLFSPLPSLTSHLSHLTDIVAGSADPSLGRYNAAAASGFDTNATYAVMYFEQNMPPLARTYVDNNYRNVLYWDGRLLATSENRPRIPLGLLRNVRWPGGVSVPRDGLTHNLTMVVNSPLAGREVGRNCDARKCTDAFWELQVCVCVCVCVCMSHPSLR
jgi:hypothetical protein